MMQKKVAEILTMQAMKLPTSLPMQAMKLPAPPTLPPPLPTTPSSQDQMILMSIALVYLRSLPSVFMYFLHITLFNLKIKISSVKTRIDHQNDVICFRKIYNK